MISLARWIRKSLGGGHSRGIRMVADIQVKSRYGQPRNDGFRNLLVVVIVVVSEWGTCSGAQFDGRQGRDTHGVAKVDG